MQNNKRDWGVRSRDRVRVRGVNRIRDRDRVRTGGEHVILFEKHPPPHTKKKKEKVGKSPS